MPLAQPTGTAQSHFADATCEAGVSWKGRAHSAATDAIATADLVTEIAKVQRDLVVQLQELQSKGNLE